MEKIQIYKITGLGNTMEPLNLVDTFETIE